MGTIVSIILLIIGALPFTYPPTGYCPTEQQPDILDVFAYEHSTGLVGVDPEGSYFPATVKTRPSGSPLEAQYAAGQSPIARFDQASLPDGATLHRAKYEPNRAKLEIETPVATRARYFAFAFPGWRVLVDRRPTDVIPSDPEGLITFDLPAGRHDVEITWGSTPLRTAASFITLISLAGAIYFAYSTGRDDLARRLKRLGKAPTSAPAPAPWTVTPIAPLEWKEVALAALLALLLLAFKLAWVDRGHTPFRRPGLGGDGSLPGLDVPLDVRFEDGVRLLGYERSAERLPANSALHLAFYWSAYARPSRSYKSTVALRGPDGQLWSDKTALPRRGYADPPPSPAWGDGRYVVDGLDVEALPGAPPGRYDLLLTAFERQTLAPLNALNEAGQVVGPNLVVGQVELTRPSRSPHPDDTPMQTRLGANLGPLTLAGVNLDRGEAAPGDPMLITLFWILDTIVPGAERSGVGYSDASGGEEWDWKELPDFGARLALVDEEGAEAMVWELPPVRDDWPTTLWEAGDLWRGQHLLRLPAALESGNYVWRLSLYESASQRTSEGMVELGRLRVNAPERLWQAPPVQLPLDVELGQQAVLLGANLEPASVLPSASLTVTLVWQGRAEMHASYRVFLHLLAPDGSLLAQSDGEPATWTRPTTGWAPGEIILDQRVLQIPAGAPPGPYTLLTGLYDPITKDRLPTPDGATAILVATLEQP